MTALVLLPAQRQGLQSFTMPGGHPITPGTEVEEATAVETSCAQITNPVHPQEELSGVWTC